MMVFISSPTKMNNIWTKTAESSNGMLNNIGRSRINILQLKPPNCPGCLSVLSFSGLSVALCKHYKAQEKRNPKSLRFPSWIHSLLFFYFQCRASGLPHCLHPAIHPAIHPSRYESISSGSRSGLHLTCHIHHDGSAALLPKCQRTQSCRKTLKHNVIMFQCFRWR